VPRASKGTQILGSTVCRGQLASSQMSSRVGIRPGPCRGQFLGTDVWLWRESRRKHELDALVPAVYLDSVLGVLQGGLEVTRMAFRGSSIFGLTGTFSKIKLEPRDWKITGLSRGAQICCQIPCSASGRRDLVELDGAASWKSDLREF